MTKEEIEKLRQEIEEERNKINKNVQIIQYQAMVLFILGLILVFSTFKCEG